MDGQNIVIPVVIVAACITALGTAINGYFAYKAATRVKTPNGRTAGDQIDRMAGDIAELRLWMVEHLRFHAEEPRSR